MTRPRRIHDLWDYDDPAGSEARFRDLLAETADDPDFQAETLPHIARAEGLQRRFEAAHATLDRVESMPASRDGVVRIRYLLERGRILNSSGQPDKAHDYFQQAYDLAATLQEDFYAVDALHMLAIVADGEEALRWNEQAVALAERSPNERARGWLGSLYNNIGWSYHDMGRYSDALAIFERALTWRREQGQVKLTRIAAWCVARTLRSLGRYDEALQRQQTLLAEAAAQNEPAGFTLEEIGECLLALDRPAEAAPYFAQAHALLSQDPWLAAQEPGRLERLGRLASPS